MIIEHDTMPIVIANTYKCIEQKNTIFIRGIWDPEFIPIHKRFKEAFSNRKYPKGIEGYTTLELALQAAAWSVCWQCAPENEYGCANQGFYEWNGEKRLEKHTFADKAEASLIIKNAAKFFGASLVGIAEYDSKWVYSSWYDFSKRQSIPPEFPFEIESVIVVAIEMEQDACLTSPSLISGAATGLGYSQMAQISKKLATFIRMLGYNAIPSGNDMALSIPIAVQAGLGEVGRNGMLITPQYGPRVRLLKIFTDMPLQPDKPITFGVSQFCIKCRKCADSCPANAIPSEPKPTMKGNSQSNCSGVLKWYTDPEKCYKFWDLNGGNCSNCIACCPYNKWSSWHHGLTEKLAEAMEQKPLFIGMPKNTAQCLNPKLILKTSEIDSGQLDSKKSAKLEDNSEEPSVGDALLQTLWLYNSYTFGDGQFGLADQGFFRWKGEISKQKTIFKDTKEAARIIKKAAKFLGADLVGITYYDEKISNSVLFNASGQKIPSVSFPIVPRSVIVLAIELDFEACQTEPSPLASAAIALGYSHLAEVAKKMAVFIRQLGYQAFPCSDDTIPSIPLAVQAGMGESGRNGLLITKEFGPRVQLCKIYTDLELQEDQPLEFGVRDFCAECRKCAEACPAGAIDSDHAPKEKWSIDSRKCLQFWLENSTDCLKCITNCAYNKPANWDKKFKEFLAKPLASLLCKHESTPGSKQFINKDILRTWWKK
ncbi:MAG TPA: reductive dehalogenase [Peptococcaceae bacterium]|nr:reductive dehalogenase [Peptococcaceae bacterium]